MIRLWQTELYKVRKSLCLKLACLGAVLYGLAEFLAIAMTSANRIYGFSALIGSFLNWEKPYLFCGIWAACYISKDTESGGFAEEITAGFSKRNIYIVKTGLFFFGSMIIIFCYQFIPTIFFSCLNGFSPVKTKPLGKSLFILEVTYMLLMIACISSCILFSFLFTRKSSSLVAEVVYTIIFLPVFQNITRISSAAAQLYHLLPYYGFQIITGNILENCSREETFGLLLPPQTAGLLGQIDSTEKLLLSFVTAFSISIASGYFIWKRFRFH